MNLTRKIGLAGAATLIITAGVLVYRYATFTAGDIGNGAGIKVAAPAAFVMDNAMQNLGTAIRFQTISHQETSENDLSAWDGLQSWMQSAYPAAHAVMQKEKVAGQSLLYTWAGSDPALQPIILMAHQDVVPVTADTLKDWKHPPFSGAIADGAVWGRGAIDDKGSLIALFEALDALAGSGFKPKRTIIIVSGHDEEVGGSGAVAAAALLAKRGIKAQFTLDEGGIIAMDAPIINGKAAMIGIAEKGYATLKITANAVGGHSSMPPKETGVVKLANAVVAINDNEFPADLKGPGKQMLQALAARKGGMIEMAVANDWLFCSLLKRQVAASQSGAAMLRTTIAPTMLSGSPKENVLPQTATALINYRIAPWNRSADIMARAQSATKGHGVMLSWVKPPREPSKTSSTNSPGWNVIVAAVKASTPEATPAPYLVLGGTDSRAMQDISDDVYRLLPFQLSLKDTAMIHGTNEHISGDNLKRAINFYSSLIATSAG